MRLQHKTRRRKVREVTRTPANLEHPGASSALKVMMMSAAGAFVTRCVARQLNRVQPSAVYQGIDGAIDGGDSKAPKRAPACHQYLKRTE